MTSTILERRHNSRERTSDPIWWKSDTDHDFRLGWLLERSSEGAAFLIRDDDCPTPGRRLSMHIWEPPCEGPASLGVVRRVMHVHGDLHLIAVRLFELRPAESAQLHLAA